jgi:cell division protein ZapA
MRSREPPLATLTRRLGARAGYRAWWRIRGSVRAMAGRTVHLRIGGQTYRVTTSASDDDLQRLAAVVDKKLATVVPPGRPVTPQAMLLAAMALAHDLEAERARGDAIKAQARGAFGRMIERVDAALGEDRSAVAALHDGASTRDGDSTRKPRAPAEP